MLRFTFASRMTVEQFGVAAMAWLRRLRRLFGSPTVIEWNLGVNLVWLRRACVRGIGSAAVCDGPVLASRRIPAFRKRAETTGSPTVCRLYSVEPSPHPADEILELSVAGVVVVGPHRLLTVEIHPIELDGPGADEQSRQRL